MAFSPPQAAGDAARRERLHLRVQQSRFAVYALAAVTALLGIAAGVLDVSYTAGLPLLAIALVTTLLLIEAYRRGLHMRAPFDLDWIWMALDVGILTWGIYLTGGVGSPWFIWYLANTSAAAFVGGRRAALAVVAANVAAYLGVLVAMGQIRGFDRNLGLALTQMAFLYGAALFFLRGILKLRDKQAQVEQLQQEQDLKVQQLVALTQDLDQGTRALAEANVQIREADRMKSRFLANMSHELRTPLNSIIGFSEILIDRLGPTLDPKQLKFLRNIHGSGQHLLGIINDILDLSKVEAGHMEAQLEEFRVAPAVEGVLNVMQGMASRLGQRFELELPEDLPPCFSDAAKFKQVLYNLLSNAVKFSPDGATVRVTGRRLEAAVSPLHEDTLEISVADEGIGIAPEHHESIFQEFVQVDASAARAAGGTGLGLALVRRFCELLGGRVRVESAPGRGSTFTVTLPLQARRAAPAPPSALRKPLAGESRVLVVEDDLVSYQALARWLSEAGYFPIRARKGEEALEMARTLRPTAITLDLSLPGLSGWDVLRALKEDERTRHLPVVVISMMDNRELGLSLGVDDYFLKPVDRERLLARIRELAPPQGVARLTRLLVIDDDPLVHSLLGDGLPAFGLEVRHAHTGREGLEAAMQGPPDAIVLDLLMPEMSGFEVAAALQARPETEHVPVIVLTAHDLKPDERARLSGKIDGLVRKGPRTPARLAAAIRELESRRTREVARAG